MTSSRRSSKKRSTRSLSVFLDSSVILSGLASPTGGSRKILEAGRKKKLRLVTTPFVIQEVGKHIFKLDIDPGNLKHLLSKKIIRLVPDPPKDIERKLDKITVDPDDVPILAGAVVSGAYVLVSLDKTHILTQKVRRSLKPIKVYSPKQFWRWIEENLE